jgi:hypothetical protein
VPPAYSAFSSATPRRDSPIVRELYQKDLVQGKPTPAINKIPISGLYENWAFTVDEIANLVFIAQGQDMSGRLVVGYGRTVEESLQNCIKKAKILDHPFQGYNFFRLLAWKIVDTVGLLIRKIRGMED